MHFYEANIRPLAVELPSYADLNRKATKHLYEQQQHTSLKPQGTPIYTLSHLCEWTQTRFHIVQVVQKSLRINKFHFHLSVRKSANS